MVHCAANTGFHVELEEIMTTNTLGFMELLKVAGGCKNLKVCLNRSISLWFQCVDVSKHLAFAYVATSEPSLQATLALSYTH